MRTKFIFVFDLFTICILFFFMPSNVFAQTQLTPQKVTAVFEGEFDQIAGSYYEPCPPTPVKLTIEVWNVGAQGGAEFESGTLTYSLYKGVCKEENGSFFLDGKPFNVSVPGTFSGGPDGVFTYFNEDKNRYEKVKFLGGTKAEGVISLVPDKLNPVTFIVVNASVFDSAPIAPKPLPVSPEPAQPIQPPVENNPVAPPIQPPLENNPPASNEPPVESSPLSGGGALAGGIAAILAAAAGIAAVLGAAASFITASNIKGTTPPIGFTLGGPSTQSNTVFDGGELECVGLPVYQVNTATLDLVIEDTVFFTVSPVPQVELSLTYNSADTRFGMFGRGWRFSYESELADQPKQVILTLGSGQTLTFQKKSKTPASKTQPIELVAPQGIYDSLVDYGTYFILFHKETGRRSIYMRQPNQNLFVLTEVMHVTSSNRLKIQRNPSGGIEKIKDAAGREIIFSYGADNRCTGFSVCDGRQAQYRYDSRGFLTEAVDLAGIPAQYSYDENGFMTCMSVDHDQQKTMFTYQKVQESVCLATVREPSGGVTTYQIIPGKIRHIRKTDPIGRTTDYFSQYGETLAVVDSTGSAVQFEYQNGLNTSIKTRTGRIYSFSYDRRGNVIAKSEPDGGTWKSVYDQNNKPVMITDPRGQVWRYTYDPMARLVCMTTPTGQAEVWEYDQRGLKTKIIRADGSCLQLEYDTFDNPIGFIDPLGRKTTFEYDKYGYKLLSITSPGGRTTRFNLDGNGRLLEEIFADGSSCRYTYNCCSRLETTDENGQATLYRIEGNLLIDEIQYPDGTHSLLEYDPVQRIKAWVDPAGEKYSSVYESSRRLEIITNPLKYKLIQQMDADGNLLNVWDENGNCGGYSYHSSGNPERFTLPSGGTLWFTYLPGGLLQSAKNARGQEIGFQYEPCGRKIKRTFLNGKPQTEIEYDALGNLTKMIDEHGSTQYSYDSAGQLCKIDFASGHQVGFKYDADGNMLNILYPDGLSASYQYDKRNRPISLKWDKGSLDCQYDLVGNLLSIKRSNHTETQYAYAPNRTISKVIHTTGKKVLAEINYARNSMGSPLALSGTYPLDPGAWEASSKFTFGTGNRILSDELGTYTYDLDGNLVNISGGRWQASFDAYNRLVEVERHGVKQNFVYDAFNHSVSTTVNGSTSHYFYDMLGRLLFIADQNQKITSCFLYIGQRLAAVYNPDLGTFYYHFDALGNCLCLTDEKGKQVASYAYSPYGLHHHMTTLAFSNPFTFVGEYGVKDEGEGLYCMHHRHYDAHTARFVQQDPIGYRGSINLYAYSDLNPTTYIDPQGTFVQLVVGGLAVLGVVGAGYLLKAGYDSFQAGLKEKIAMEDAKNMMVHTGPRSDVAFNLVDKKCNPTGFYTSPTQEVLGMGDEIRKVVGEKIVPKPVTGPVGEVVFEGVMAVGGEVVNRTMDKVGQKIKDSRTKTLQPPVKKSPSCKKK